MTMNRTILVALAASAALFAGAASAQQAQAPAPAPAPAPNPAPFIDWEKVQIKTTDLGHNTYRLEGQGGNITIAVGTDGIIMVDGQFAPLSAKIKAAIAAISPLPIKYLINTHFHGDHTGGNENFAKDGAIIVAQENIKTRLAAGSTNGITGIKTAPLPPDALPKETYVDGTKTLQVGGRTAVLTHTPHAHTDGDTWVYFADANVISTGDTSNNTKKYQTVDFANGGDIRGMIAANDAFLKMGNDDTKYVVGHGPLAKKSDVQEFHDMLVVARDRIEKLVNEGKSEADVVAMRPLADLDAKWAVNDSNAVAFTRMVYNSFKRS
jgi:glyoxylase-like metal-dependent hydrolase (beta-lactamase superfamily II)